MLFTFLKIKSKKKAAVKSNPPATTKSNGDQLISLVNCIPMNGTAKTNAAAEKMAMLLCFCVIIFVFNLFIIKNFEIQSVFSKKYNCYFPKSFSNADKCCSKACLPELVTR